MPRRRSWLYGETKKQRAKNMLNGQKPDHMSWEDWCDHSRKGYFSGYECHWYDPWYGREHNTVSCGGCSGGTGHNHQPRIMRWYWASPLAWIIPPLYFMWEARVFVFSGLLQVCGWYKLIDKMGWWADERCTVKGCMDGRFNGGLCVEHFEQQRTHVS